MRPSPRHLPALADDVYLHNYMGAIRRRAWKMEEFERRLTHGRTSLADFAAGHEYYGLHHQGDHWVMREWAPNATCIKAFGTFSDWKVSDEFMFKRISAAGDWELKIPSDRIAHGDLYRLRVEWWGGAGERLPAYGRRMVQDDHTKIFSAQVWHPGWVYSWRNKAPYIESPIIYEAHVGMAQDREGVGTYEEFRVNVLPRIVDAGYNTIQLMAIMEHPYYGSFGYHVANYFAASSRFGAPEDLKRLVDDAHGMGLAVIMDIIHSHSAKNEAEGLSRFDGTSYQYFHDGPRGEHVAWDSRCFNYGKTEVLHFLLSNCRFWIDEYSFDGYRFDGITSMLYHDRGLGTAFDHYDKYFGDCVDEDAYVYLGLANKVIHQVKSDAITIAEDISGMPGLVSPPDQGGAGFDYRLSMGVTDHWYKLLKDVREEDWSMDVLWHELTQRRPEERTISYAECHDQSIVGGKTVIFQMADADMYGGMGRDVSNLAIDRAMALHKIIRLITLGSSHDGYLNFIGNEFGHPEWVDFPREGNNWSYKFARRQWRLRDDQSLRYHFLADFDREMMRVVGGARIVGVQPARILYTHCGDLVLAFERGSLVFVFNFHPTRSLPEYFIDAPHGDYRHVFDTDEARFGGHSRISSGQMFHSHGDHLPYRVGFRVYLPCRTAMVLQKVR